MKKELYEFTVPSVNSGQLFATNSIISYNTGNPGPASAVYVNGGTAALVNCTVAYNGADGLNLAGGTASALNSIFFYNGYNGTSYGTQITGATNIYGSVTSGSVVLTVTTNGGAVQEIDLYAGLDISGWPQHTYVLSYTTDLGADAVWTPLATNYLTSPNWFYVDMGSPSQPRRFYRVQLN